jgi:glutamyl-tRNA reductase
MNVSVLGISHHTAPVEVREKFALPGDLAGRLLQAVHTENVLEEAVVLDTCNRTELYFVPRGSEDPLEYLWNRIADLKGIPSGPTPDPSALYRYDGDEAVRHLFRVAAALDSQIVGEHQIIGQVKTAYGLAVEKRTARFLLNKLLHRAFRVGKRVQAETDLGRGSTSVAQEAVDLADQIFSDLSEKAVMLVGAGETAELAARRLIGRGVRRVVVANRTLERAQVLAARLAEDTADAEEEVLDLDSQPVRCPALLQMLSGRSDAAADSPQRPATRAIELADIPQAIADVDLVICSTGAPEPVLRSEELADTIGASSRLLFIVDLAVPRDVDPALSRLPNVFLYNMDDLDRVVTRNIERRRQEIPRANAIVEAEVREFVKWSNALQVTPTIALLQKRFDLLRAAEIKRYGKQFSPEGREQLDPFTEGLCKKLIHAPIAYLRKMSEEAGTGEQLAAVDAIRQMFDLDALEDSE